MAGRTKSKHRAPLPPKRERAVGEPLPNPRRELFAQEYVKDHIGGAAYRRAGFKAKGNSADVCAARLLREVHVAARVRELDVAALARVEVEQDEVLQELRYLLFSDVRDYVVRDGQIETREGVPLIATRAVSGFKFKRREVTRKEETEVTEEYEIRLWDKNDAIGKAGNRLNLFPQRQNNLNVDLATLTEEQLARIANGEDPLHVLFGVAGSR